MLDFLKAPVLAFQDFIILGGLAIRNVFRGPHYTDDIALQMDIIGVQSLPVVIMVGFFTGGVMGLQMSRALATYGAQGQIGQIVAITLVRELGPVLTAWMIAGRNGSGIASELGSMKVTEQIDAMRALGTDPIQKLVTPRLIAAAVMLRAADGDRRFHGYLRRLRDCVGGDEHRRIGVLEPGMAVAGVQRRGAGATEAVRVRPDHRPGGLLLRDADQGRNTGRGPVHNPGSGGGTDLDHRGDVLHRPDLRQSLMQPNEDSIVVRFEDVSLEFDTGDRALDGVSLELRPGETKIVLGAAGAGKTVMLKAALGLLQPTGGKVFLFGQDITRMSEERMFELRAQAGILFQEGGLFDSQTVQENVGYPLVNRGSRTDPAEVDKKVREALRFVELEHTMEQFPSALSGGMRRRVGIARAVVTEPPLVIYDSPTAGLDPITANTIMALIVKERDLRDTATLMATHRYQDGQLMANFRYNPDSGEIQRISQNGESSHSTKFLVMRDGRIVFEGTQPELEASTDSYISKFVLRR